MHAGLATREHRAAGGLHRPDPDVREGVPEHRRDARDRAPVPTPTTKPSRPSPSKARTSSGRSRPGGRRVVGVGELAREEGVLDRGADAPGFRDGPLHDLPRRGQHALRPVGPQQLAALLGEVLGHGEDEPVAQRRAGHRQADPRVAAGGFDDGAASGDDVPPLLGRADHGHGDAVLDGAPRVEALELRPEGGAAGVAGPPDPHDRGVPDEVEHTIDAPARHLRPRTSRSPAARPWSSRASRVSSGWGAPAPHHGPSSSAAGPGGAENRISASGRGDAASPGPPPPGVRPPVASFPAAAGLRRPSGRGRSPRSRPRSVGNRRCWRRSAPLGASMSPRASREATTASSRGDGAYRPFVPPRCP